MVKKEKHTQQVSNRRAFRSYTRITGQSHGNRCRLLNGKVVYIPGSTSRWEKYTKSAGMEGVRALVSDVRDKYNLGTKCNVEEVVRAVERSGIQSLESLFMVLDDTGMTATLRSEIGLNGPPLLLGFMKKECATPPVAVQAMSAWVSQDSLDFVVSLRQRKITVVAPRSHKAPSTMTFGALATSLIDSTVPAQERASYEAMHLSVLLHPSCQYATREGVTAEGGASIGIISSLNLRFVSLIFSPPHSETPAEKPRVNAFSLMQSTARVLPPKI